MSGGDIAVRGPWQGEYFWAPRRPDSELRHSRRDARGRVVRSVKGASGRPKTDDGDSLHAQIDMVTGSLRSWLLTGTRRNPIDPRRRQGVHEGLKQILTEDEERYEGAGQEISESMKRQAVVEALNRLSSEESQVIKLAYFGGKTNEEIASSTGMPVSSVRRRLRDGLRELQAQLESTGVVDLGRGRRGLAELLFWLGSRLANRRSRPRPRVFDFANGDSGSFVQSALAPTAATVVLGLAVVGGGGASQAGLFNPHAPTP